MGSVIDGSMVVSINTLDKSVADEFAEANKVIVASPKKDTKEAKVSKSPAEKPAASAAKEETKNEGVQNGSASEKKVENGKENGSEKKEEVKDVKEVKDLKEVTNGEGGKVRESPRQKAKEAEKKAAQVAKNDEEKQPAKNEEKSEVVEKKSDAKPELNASAASLAKEKELKGFKDNGEETVGSIVLQPEEVSGTLFDSPRPNKTPGKGLKGTTPNRARVSPFRKSERLQNVSTAVNLSTVSEQSGEVAQSPAVDQSFGSLRHITGRRSMTNRPLREYTFQSIHRESYRKLDDDSISSVNATVGSEIHCDSFRTPIVASVKGRKRELTPQDSDDDILIVDKTPAASKRARLDFSALLGFMASPVTLLRNKFQVSGIFTEEKKFTLKSDRVQTLPKMCFATS